MNLQEFRRILERTLFLPLILLMLLAVLLAWQIRRTLAEQRLIDHSDRIAAQLNEAQRLFSDEVSSLRDYQLSHDPLTLGPLKAAAVPLQTALSQLDILIANDPQQQLLLRQIRDSHAIWLGIAAQLQQQIKSQDLRKASVAPADPSLEASERQAMNSLRAEVHSMMQIESMRRHQLIHTTGVQVRTLMTVLAVSSIGLGLLLGFSTLISFKKVSNAFRSSLDEEHQRADELFESRQWLQTTLDSIGDGLIACDRRGKIDFMNPVAQHLTGWSLEDAKGRYLDEVFRTVDLKSRAPTQSPIQMGTLNEAGAGLAHPAVLLRRAGGESLIEDSVAPIRGAAGEPAGAVLVFRDVTEQRQAQAALLANEKLAVAGRLAASIAHEIHNPLDAVANLHHLMEHESDPSRQRQFLEMAQQELARTLQISRAMLGLYREPQEPVEVNLRELLESVLILLDRRLKEEGIVIESNLDSSATIEGFPGELRQVFTNLITNAAEAASPGGRICVRLDAAPSLDAKRGAVVTITDSGSGLPEGMKDKLFQPFVTTKGEQGTGLGLWVSRGIVEKHGGTLEIVNATDGELRGARVRVYLPSRASVSSGQAASRLSADEQDRSGAFSELL